MGLHCTAPEVWCVRLESATVLMKLTTPGPVVRVAPNELSFASPNAVRDIFAVGKGFTKTEFYKVRSESRGYNTLY